VAFCSVAVGTLDPGVFSSTFAKLKPFSNPDVAATIGAKAPEHETIGVKGPEDETIELER
jgi:hypothetical protein